ncbi:TlpA family protein disulfide reductase [Micropruina sp.]|uniref:TlpA family protein disulfide reductase n=1 Tax=Micropruina sp. TaxID=2737536 RepID=UPI0039E4856E
MTGCTITRLDDEPTDPSYTPATEAEVLAARKAAGIADCPKSDSDVPARADGLPDLTVDCLGGDSTVRLAGLRGKPMVINLWAQWCPPCRAESPYFRQFAQAGKGKVLLLGLNYGDPRPDLAVEFASLVRWKYPQLADPDRNLGTRLNLPAIPITLFVAADGRLVRTFVGGLHSYDELVQLTRDELGVKL